MLIKHRAKTMPFDLKKKLEDRVIAKEKISQSGAEPMISIDDKKISKRRFMVFLYE